MSDIKQTVHRSYQLLELLTVCSFAAKAMDTVVSVEDLQNLGASISHCLELATELAGEVHDELENAKHGRRA